MTGLHLLSSYHSTILREFCSNLQISEYLDSLCWKFNTNPSTNSNPATGKKLIDIE